MAMWRLVPEKIWVAHANTMTPATNHLLRSVGASSGNTACVRTD